MPAHLRPALQVSGTRYSRPYDTAGQNDVTIGRSAAAVTDGDGRESAIDFVLIYTRQYDLKEVHRC